MTTLPGNWESTLIERAEQALHEWAPVHNVEPLAAELQRAYDHCANLTSLHSRTFFLASGLLPSAKRMAARALYAFCRVSDEIVDGSEADPQAALAEWRRRLLAPPAGNDPVVQAWADTRARYHIPQIFVTQLLDGVSADLVRKSYDTFAELAEYCYGVACTVGLMAMHIVGFSSLAALPYAIKLGVALQLTNILRDVGEDWRAGRVYLPREELDAFGLSANDLAVGGVSRQWRAFMSFQIDRARQLYRQAWPGVALLHHDGRFAIAAASQLYEAILDDIIAHRCDVFRRRAHVSTWGKLRRLPGIWRRSQRLDAAHTP